MQVTVMSLFFWALLLAVQIYARPQELDIKKAIRADMTKEMNGSDAWNSSTTIKTTLSSTSMKFKDVGSRVEPSNAERDLKGYQYMDNSLRTVATQLFNVSNNIKEKSNLNDNTMSDKVESRLGLLIHKSDNTVKEIQSNRDYNNDNIKSDMIEIDAIDVHYDRSKNSKYNYFKTSHPGEAMAMTEEELERELSLSKLMTTNKKKSTTTGGISTWILLNPPSTTAKSLMSDKIKNTTNKKDTEKKTILSLIKSTLPAANIETSVQLNSTTPLIHKNSPTRTTPLKIVHKQTSTTLKADKLTSPVNFYTTPRLEITQNTFDSTLNNTTTKQIVSSNRTVKPIIITTPKTTAVISQATTIKVVKLGNINQLAKSNSTQKLINKSEHTKNPLNVTSKIEKVTFRPVQMITTPKSSIHQAVPMFVTKLQASLHTNSKSNSPYVSSNMSIDSIPIKDDIPKINTTFTKRVHAILKQKPLKPNNVLNVQLKKPIDTNTRIEIQPIKVNAPILTIEKIEEPKKDIEIEADNPIAVGNSKIDVKFVFNPELTKIIESPTGSIATRTSTTAAPTTTTTTTSTTTKRPKHKRKKNKTRRRKPSISTTSNPITTSAITILNTNTNNIDENQVINDDKVNETSLQESKIVPESDTSTNTTKNKKKQVQKPIGSQIYSFLSREVMPSVGVMSLVGLGLGLASYFLYPFGGTIARRNYEIQPNYKYNLNEYGGNYGQSEEEVFSKVLQGMASDDIRYGGMKDYENNYYRYQPYDGAYTDQMNKKNRGDIRYATSSVPIYRPDNTPMPYNSKYRKSEFQYSDMSTTPKYNERHTELEFVNNQGNADRQFVVGNIPKGYGQYEDKSMSKLSTTSESSQIDFEKQIAASLKFVDNPVNISPNFHRPTSQAIKSNEGYDEIEITPTAVAVEHGPRSLKLENIQAADHETLMNDKSVIKMRRKRDSFIQQIPTRDDMKKMENDEDISNEILDIIDSAMPTILPQIVYNKVNDIDKQQVDEINVKVSTSNEQTPLKSQGNNIGNKTITPTTTTVQSTVTEKKSSSNSNKLITPTVKNFTINETTVTAEDSSISSTTSSSLSSNTHITMEIGKPNDITISNVTETFNSTTESSPPQQRFNFVQFIKKIAEIKFRVGLTVLKHASESFTKYLGNVQKKLNGEE